MANHKLSSQAVKHWWNRLFSLLQLLCLPLAVWWIPHSHLPPPGCSVAFIAFAAAAMSVHDELKSWQKALWMILMGAFLVTELRAIRWDRAVTDAKAVSDKAESDQKAAAALKAQNDGFVATLTGLAGVTTSSQAQFQATMKRANGILDTTKKVAAISETSLESMEGKDSYPCVVPSLGVRSDGKIVLNVWGRGPHSLSGVSVRILPPHVFRGGGDEYYAPAIELGTINPLWPKAISEAITPELPDNGVGSYWIDVWTQNGVYTENLNIRQGKTPNTWAYQYWLGKQVMLDGPSKQFPNAPKGARTNIMMKDCQKFAWSDDLPST